MCAVSLWVSAGNALSSPGLSLCPSEALLNILDSFPSSETPLQYLEAALNDGLLPLHIYVANFPKAVVASKTLQSQATVWSSLLAMTLKTHGSRSEHPKTLLSRDSSPRNAESVESVILMLKASYGLSPHTAPVYNMVPAPESGTLQESVTRSLIALTIVILSEVSAMAAGGISQSASANLVSSVTDLIQLYPLGDARSTLENWLLSFTVASGAIDAMLRMEDDLGLTVAAPPQQESTDGSKSEPVPLEEDIVAPVIAIRILVSVLQLSLFK